jgi:hypothetical protein
MDRQHSDLHVAAQLDPYELEESKNSRFRRNKAIARLQKLATVPT